MSYYQKQLYVIKKKQGFCTEADRVVEEFLIERLIQLVPEATIYSEESGMSGSMESAYCWVIDPLDGTTNFTHGLPYFCISVALTLYNKPIMGTIYQPLLEELFYAERDAGAWVNGLFIEKKRQIPGIPIMVTSPWVLSQIKRKKRACVIRFCGAAALDCAYLACGKYDGLQLKNLAWWDVAAGILLLTEARVPVTYTGGIPPDYKVGTLKAGEDFLNVTGKS